MNLDPPPYASQPRAALHVIAVGLVVLLFNAWGALVAITAQSGQLPVRPEDAAYFAAQPLWFVLFADLAPLAGVAGALALLLQSRTAVALFGLQAGVLLLANGYELMVGTSLLLSNEAAMMGTIGLAMMLAAQIAYALWLRRHGLLT